jgi:hypothetical protein
MVIPQVRRTPTPGSLVRPAANDFVAPEGQSR